MSADPSQQESWWPQLSAVPVQMAQEVAQWLPVATVASYQDFLNMMYHYTLGSEDRLRGAAKLTPDEGLRAFYLELADEEAFHFELARQDLAAFGRQPRDETPAEVARFEAFWQSIGSEDHAAHLGALYALESVASHLAQKAVAELGRLKLGPKEARFVLVHLEADEEHGSMCQAHCQRVGAVDPESLLRGARSAAGFWVEMHRCLGAV